MIAPPWTRRDGDRPPPTRAFGDQPLPAAAPTWQRPHNRLEGHLTARPCTAIPISSATSRCVTRPTRASALVGHGPRLSEGPPSPPRPGHRHDQRPRPSVFGWQRRAGRRSGRNLTGGSSRLRYGLSGCDQNARPDERRPPSARGEGEEPAEPVTLVHGRLRIEVRDDGVGGAAACAGTGLRGLADRVDALGGRLRIDSPARRGTTLTAKLPCRS